MEVALELVVQNPEGMTAEMCMGITPARFKRGKAGGGEGGREGGGGGGKGRKAGRGRKGGEEEEGESLFDMLRCLPCDVFALGWCKIHEKPCRCDANGDHGEGWRSCGNQISGEGWLTNGMWTERSKCDDCKKHAGPGSERFIESGRKYVRMYERGLFEPEVADGVLIDENKCEEEEGGEEVDVEGEEG